MIKNSIFSLILFFSTIGTINAQVLNTDSIKKVAQIDVQKFKLNNKNLRTFRKDGKNPNSDFFKPTREYTSISTLLNDSTYVAAFRALAYKKTKRRKTIAHYILVGGITYAMAVAIITIPIAATH